MPQVSYYVGVVDRGQVWTPQDQDAELAVMNQYMEMLISTLSTNTSLKMAYLAFQADIINETAFEGILISNKKQVQATIKAINREMIQKPKLFHIFVQFLRKVNEDEMAHELQTAYGKRFPLSA